ncbi:MAG: c-type cytochrome [Candidatus Omnitrophica bacterium]|nr:c-type cytochrome [Candidatus Omnitrophota bacterium]
MPLKRVAFLVVIGVCLCAFDIPVVEASISVSFVKQEASLDPFDAIWQRIPKVQIPLIPQTLFTPRGGGATKEVHVQTFYTRNFLYVRLEWADATQATAQEAHRTEGFDDTVAIQLPLVPEKGMPSPFMGDPEHPVNIWHWKASWQEALGVDPSYPRTVRDDEPFAQEATFRTGEAVGNLFSQTVRAKSVEHLLASGFGTLTPTQTQSVEGLGVWQNGHWHVVMRRALMPQDDAVEVNLRGAQSLPIAFAVWDGANQERNGMKSISVWQTLIFAQPVALWEKTIQWVTGFFRREPSQTPEKIRLAMIEKGKSEVLNYGCIICHGAGGRGGIRNPNAATFQEVPPLVYVAKGFTKEELKEKIRQGSTPARLDPRGTAPERLMSAWHPVMDDEKLGAVVAYLMSLLPEEAETW